MTNLAVRKAEAQKALASIFIPNRRTERICAAFDELIERKRIGAGVDHGSVLIVGPSQSGKSTGIKEAVNRHSAPDYANPSIMHVTVPPSVNQKSLLHAIFDEAERRGLFRPDSVAGNQWQLQARAYRLLQHNQIDALVLDECHHIKYGTRQDAGEAVGEMIKTFLIEGPCPVILAGVGDNAKKPYLHNQQLMNRSLAFVELAPLDTGCKSDREFLNEFFSKYFAEMTNLKIASNLRELAESEFVRALYTASGGVVGVAIRLIQRAVALMIEDERCSLSHCDFYRAHDGLALTRELQTENPFMKLHHAGLAST